MRSVIAWATVAVCACAPSEELLPLPSLPDVATVDPVPRQQLLQRHAAVAELLRERVADAEELGPAYGQLGEVFHAYQDLESARTCYANSHSLQPELFRWTYLLAHAERTLGHYAEATIAFERALKLNPDDVPTLVWLAEIDLEQHRLSSAGSRFQQALSIDPQCVRAQFGLGMVALEHDEYGEAIGHLEQASAVQPAASSIQYNLGLAYRGLGDTTRAASFFDESSTRAQIPIAFQDPILEEVGDLRGSSSVYVRRGMMAANQGLFDAAVKEFKLAMEANPERPSTRYNFAGALLKLGRPQEALAQLEELVELDPAYTRGHVLLARVLAKGGHSDRAERHLRRASQVDPDSERVHEALGNLLRENGRHEEALVSFSQALQLAPGSARARFGAGVALALLGRFEEALVLAEEGAHALPGRAELRMLLARLLATAPDNAQRDGKRALDLAASDPAGEQTITEAETTAMALAELGRFEEAVRWQQASVAGAEAGGGDFGWMKERLSLYLQRKPCRRPWESTEQVSSLHIVNDDG